MSDDLEKRLAEARARKATLEAERAERERVAELQRSVEREEREARDLEAIAAAEAAHGALGTKIMAISTDLGVVILKRPHIASFRKFQDLDSPKAKDFEALARACLVHPKADEFDSINEQLPGVLMRCADAVCWLAGVRKGELSGKS